MTAMELIAVIGPLLRGKLQSLEKSGLRFSMKAP